jgi:hypothetical protein
MQEEEWRYQRGNQNPYIKGEQIDNTMAKRTNNDLQNIHIKRTPLKTGGELGCSGRVSSSYFTNGTRRVYLVTHPMISHEWRKDREVLTTSRTYLWSLVTQIFHNGQPYNTILQFKDVTFLSVKESIYQFYNSKLLICYLIQAYRLSSKLHLS